VNGHVPLVVVITYTSSGELFRPANLGGASSKRLSINKDSIRFFSVSVRSSAPFTDGAVRGRLEGVLSQMA
jgi:hypothetical protein